MPTQENLEGLLSENEEKDERESGTLVNVAQERAKPNLTDTQGPTPDEMTKEEALAIIWTGLEVLARRSQAVLFQSQVNGCVIVNLLATELTKGEGLKALADFEYPLPTVKPVVMKEEK